MPFLSTRNVENESGFVRAKTSSAVDALPCRENWDIETECFRSRCANNFFLLFFLSFSIY